MGWLLIVTELAMQLISSPLLLEVERLPPGLPIS